MGLSVTNQERIREWLKNRFAKKWTKPEVREAIDATDDWLDDTTAKAGGVSNQGSYVTYLNANAPSFGGANSTAEEKTLLFAAVVLYRAGYTEIV